MFVKICANTNLEDALLAAQLGVDAVGFVFAPSKRRISAEQVEALTCALPACVEKVGVFAGADSGEIAACVAHAGLTVVQLHGPFDVATVRELAANFAGSLKIIQTVAYAVDATDRDGTDRRFEETLRVVFEEPAVWAVLIDAAMAGASGGLGVTFDWAHVAGIVERAIGAREPRPRIILAGGLHAENVAKAITELKPWGVDVASGVEASPGKKDVVRLRAFVAAARNAASQLQPAS